jgi:plastocyanin
VRERAVALHPQTRLSDVLGVCSVLVGDRPVSAVDPAAVEVAPGESVEFLPPFAGG